MIHKETSNNAMERLVFYKEAPAPSRHRDSLFFDYRQARPKGLNPATTLPLWREFSDVAHHKLLSPSDLTA